MDRRTLLLGSLGIGPLGFGPVVRPATATGLWLPESAQDATKVGPKRFALILANQNYEKNPLPNILSDARLMDTTLKGLGFTTTSVLDADRNAMLEGIRRFKAMLMPGSLVLLYYSGHGAQVDGENYLIPRDNGRLDDADAAKDHCIALGGPNGLLEKLGRTPGQLNLIILDACRDDPFPAATKSQGSKGLAVVARPVSGDYIAMAASPGQTASANPRGMNSLYTQELARRLATPGLRLEDVFIETRNAVVAASAGRQVPQEFGTLTARVFLAGAGSPSPDPSIPAVPEVKIPSTAIRLDLVGVPTGAKVTVDDQLLSGNVYTDEIAAKTKEVEVAVDAAGFRPFVRTVVLKRGEAARLEVSLEAKPVAPVVPAVRPSVSSRLTDYPQLRAYVESLRPIPAGTFQMGSTSEAPGERPKHTVRLSGFRMGATPVTVAMWREYCVATGASMPPAPDWGWVHDHPMLKVSWNDIMGADGKGGYVAWAGEVAGFTLTLPTEAQWEYAALGGRDGVSYPWGNNLDVSKLWCSQNTNRSSTAPVSRSSNVFRNGYGLTDMSGNVWQWCSDWFGPYSSGEQTDPLGPDSGVERCLRGGSWVNGVPDYFRCASRVRGQPDYRSGSLGFRLSAGPA